MFARTIAPAAALAALLAAAPAQAQAPIQAGVPFCNGHLVVDSFYNTVTSNGAGSRVDYMMQLRNTSGAPRTAVVSFIYQGSRNNLNRSANRLGAYQSVTLRLGQDFLNNPAGNGALSPQHDVPTMVRINCG